MSKDVRPDAVTPPPSAPAHPAEPSSPAPVAEVEAEPSSPAAVAEVRPEVETEANASSPAPAAPRAAVEVAMPASVLLDKKKKDKPKKDKAKKKDKTKKEDPKAEIVKDVALTDDQKEAIRLRAESRLKKEYERTVDARLRADMNVDEAELKALKKKLVKAQGSPERGIETWFRLASRNLYTRRQIVDTKSNILITVNSIILSVVLGTMSREIADQPHLAIAIVPLVVANLFSMAFAIFATKPRIAPGIFTPEEVQQHRVSLMTFDDFYKMGADDYDSAITKVLDDRDLLYGTIQRDIYSLGIDLSRRYQQIQRAYSVFLTGIVFATLLFGLTTYYLT